MVVTIKSDQADESKTYKLENFFLQKWNRTRRALTWRKIAWTFQEAGSQVGLWHTGDICAGHPVSEYQSVSTKANKNKHENIKWP